MASNIFQSFNLTQMPSYKAHRVLKNVQYYTPKFIFTSSHRVGQWLNGRGITVKVNCQNWNRGSTICILCAWQSCAATLGKLPGGQTIFWGSFCSGTLLYAWLEPEGHKCCSCVYTHRLHRTKMKQTTVYRCMEKKNLQFSHRHRNVIQSFKIPCFEDT